MPAVYVASHLYQWDTPGKSTVLRAGLCYISAEEGLTVAGKYIYPVPDNIDVEAAEVPFMIKLAPGQSHEGYCEEARPARIRTPYDKTKNEAGDILRLRIGYIREDKLGGLAGPWKSKVDHGQDLYMSSYDDGLATQIFAEFDINP